MNAYGKLSVRVLAASLMLTLCHSTWAAEANGIAEPAAAPTSVDPALQQRIQALKQGIPGRLARKPKIERVQEAQNYLAARASGKQLDRFDQPQEANLYFLTKRLPEGKSTIGPEDYAKAIAQANAMPLYSTTLNRPVAPPSAVTRGKVSTQTRPGLSPTAGLSGAWTALGPGNVGGRTRAFVIHPATPNIMWVAGVAGGIWKSTDAGASWVPKSDFLSNIAISTMILDPRNTNTLYAGTGEGYFNGDAVRGAGIMKSTDGGETWSQLPSTTGADFRYVQKVVMTKGASQRIYAATSTGVFRSTDAGASWTKVLDGSTVNGCMDLAIQTDRALANVFASCGTFTQGTVYRALDTAGAQTWTAVLTDVQMGRTSLAIAPSSQSTVYAIASDKTSYGFLALWRSTSSGGSGTWVRRVDNTAAVTLNRQLFSNPVYAYLQSCGFGSANQQITQGWYDNTLVVDPVNPNVVWVGGIDLFRSDDGGASFGQASHWWFTKGVDPEYNHADQHVLVFHPQYDGVSNKTMYSLNDGGINFTSNALAPVSYSPDPVTSTSPVCGNTAAGVVAWGQLNNGYQVTQFYHGVHSPDGNTFFGGTQDNGTPLGTIAGGSNAWTTIKGGDGGYVALNPANTSMLWAENTGLSIQRSSNSGSSYVSFTSGITEATGNFLFITPFAQDPSDPNKMWIGGARPWRTASAAAATLPTTIWAQAGQFMSARISALAVSPLSSDRVYVGTQSVSGTPSVSGVVYTTGAGTTASSTTVWTGSKPRPGVNYVSWITPDPVTLGTVYATVSTFNDGTGTGHVFKSTDFGTTWVSIDGSGVTGIPDVPAHSIMVDPLNAQTLYVGTDIGIFVSLDGGANWARENTGFANVIVETMSIKNTTPRYIYAYTHGRSAFRAPLP